jgi:HK97 family phage major capsid protein
MKLTFEKFLEGKSLSKEEFSKKGAEEMAAFFIEFNEAKAKELEEAMEAKADSSEIVSLQKQMNDALNTQMSQMNESLKSQGLMITKLSQEEKDVQSKGFDEQIRTGLKENLENLQSLKENKNGGFSMEVKVPGTMTFGTNVSGGNIPVEDRIEGLDAVKTRRISLLDLMTSRTTASNVVSWVSQANIDGGAAQTGEGTDKSQMDFDLVVNSESLKKTTSFIKISTEMLDDIEWIEGEIRTELMRQLLLQVESQAYSGDGTGNNLNGIATVASAFVAGSFAAAIDNANEVDVLTVAINNIEVANQEGPTAILMHPTDVTKLLVTKLSTTDKRYVDRLIQVGSNLMLDGVPIIKTTLVTEGDYLIGNFPLALLVNKGGVKFDVGLEGDDFKKNLRTILVEWRGLVIVKSNDRGAFIAGDFATDKAALETA